MRCVSSSQSDSLSSENDLDLVGEKCTKSEDFEWVCIYYRGREIKLNPGSGRRCIPLEQARVDQTAVVPGSYGPSPCPNVTALVHFGIAAFFFVAGSREPEFPRTLPYYLVDNCAWL